MTASSRFAVATHIMTLLAQQAEPATSEYVASSVNTNPVVIRRIMGALREAGLVSSQGGNGGGWRLVGDADRITLRDVYRAVEDEALFALHHRQPNPECPVGRTIQLAFTERLNAATTALEAELARTTIAEMLRDTLARVN